MAGTTKGLSFKDKAQDGLTLTDTDASWDAYLEELQEQQDSLRTQQKLPESTAETSPPREGAAGGKAKKYANPSASWASCCWLFGCPKPNLFWLC